MRALAPLPRERELTRQYHGEGSSGFLIAATVNFSTERAAEGNHIIRKFGHIDGRQLRKGNASPIPLERPVVEGVNWAAPLPRHLANPR